MAIENATGIISPEFMPMWNPPLIMKAVSQKKGCTSTGIPKIRKLSMLETYGA